MRKLPYVVTALFPFQSVLAALGVRYALYALLAGGTAAFLFRVALRGGKVTGLGAIWVVLLYLMTLVVARPSIVSLYGFLVYGQFALFWVSYILAYGEVDLPKLTRTNLRVAVVIALIGIYQYFFNPTLWGFSTYGGVGTFFYAGAALRINSLLPSAMSLGAYLVISALLALAFLPRRGWTLVSVGTCVGCALLTGNKSTLFMLGALALYMLVQRDGRRGSLLRPLIHVALVGGVYLLLLALSDVWLPWLERFNPTLYRATAPFFFSDDTASLGRLVAIWRMLFVFYGGSGFGSIMFGNGVGITRQETTFIGGQPLGDFPVAESFVVQLLFETGVVGLALFHVLLWMLYRAAKSARPPGKLGVDHVLVALYANMIVVHVFSTIFTGFLWGYFVSLLAVPRQTRQSVSETLSATLDPA